MASAYYDVIVVGTGAGGGTLAHRLAPTGKQILLLERGDYVPRERENWDSHAVVTEGRYNIAEAWRDKDGKAFHAGAHYFVGGNTKFYGAALLRMRESDFGYVHGLRGADPTEPKASAPYFYPPVSHEPRIQKIFDGPEGQGHHPFPIPIGLMIDERNPRTSKCIRCGTCDGFPCLVSAKADAQVVCVDPALEYPNVTLVTNAFVSRLETNASGTEVTEVHVTRDGMPEVYRGDIVVSSAGAINSAALLLRSASDRHPCGLANGSHQVGRNYMCHLNSMFLAISRHPNHTRQNKTLGLNDFYFATDEWEYPMGHISLMGNVDGNVLRQGAPRIVPGMTLEMMAEHAVPFWMTSEDLPDAENRVTVDGDGTIRLACTPNNEEAHRHLIGKLKGLLKHIECDHEHPIPLQAYVPGRIPLAGVAHQNGTVRFGTDPKTSVLDPTCRTHEVENLYVGDGGFFASSTAVNPALTIMANAMRVGDRLKARLA